MSFRSAALVQQTFTLPDDLDDEPGNPMTWTCKQVDYSVERQLWEIFAKKGWRSVASIDLLHAWFTFVDSTFSTIDENTKGKNKTVLLFQPKEDMRFDDFVEAWDQLPPEVRDWVITECVETLNPHWAIEGDVPKVA